MRGNYIWRGSLLQGWLLKYSLALFLRLATLFPMPCRGQAGEYGFQIGFEMDLHVVLETEQPVTTTSSYPVPSAALRWFGLTDRTLCSFPLPAPVAPAAPRLPGKLCKGMKVGSKFWSFAYHTFCRNRCGLREFFICRYFRMLRLARPQR